MTACKITIIYSKYFKADFSVWNAASITSNDECWYPQLLFWLWVQGRHRKPNCVVASALMSRNSPWADYSRKAGLYWAKVVCELIRLIWGPTGTSESIPWFPAPRTIFWAVLVSRALDLLLKVKPLCKQRTPPSHRSCSADQVATASPFLWPQRCLGLLFRKMHRFMCIWWGCCFIARCDLHTK